MRNRISTKDRRGVGLEIYLGNFADVIEGLQWSSEDDDAADLFLSTNVVGDLDNEGSSQASGLACADAARSPSI